MRPLVELIAHCPLQTRQRLREGGSAGASGVMTHLAEPRKPTRCAAPDGGGTTPSITLKERYQRMVAGKSGSSTDQGCSRDHNPRNERSHAGEQQKILQHSDHGSFRRHMLRSEAPTQ
jgi:hypothetical protein